MKKVWLFFAVILLLFSCSSSDDEDESSSSRYEQLQDETYMEVVNNIVGTWVGSQKLENGVWYDLDEDRIYQWYTFNKDGTFSQIYSSLSYTGTYVVEKNEDYLTYPLSQCKVFLILTHSNGVVNRKSVWVDTDGCLRLDSVLEGISTTNSTRYVKQ